MTRPARTPHVRERSSFAVPGGKEWRCGTFGPCLPGKMELMTRNCHVGPDWVRERLEVPVTDTQAWFGKAGFDGKKPNHFMALARVIDQFLTEHHVPAAFAVDCRASPGRLPNAVSKSSACRNSFRMQFRISTRQIDRVCSYRRRFVRQWREEADFCSGTMPVREQMLVGEGKRLVPGDGNSLAERRDRIPIAAGRPDGRGHGQKPVEIHEFCRKGPGPFHEGIKIIPLLRLHETEVPGRDFKLCASRNCADHRIPLASRHARHCAGAGETRPD